MIGSASVGSTVLRFYSDRLADNGSSPGLLCVLQVRIEIYIRVGVKTPCLSTLPHHVCWALSPPDLERSGMTWVNTVLDSLSPHPI